MLKTIILFLAAIYLIIKFFVYISRILLWLLGRKLENEIQKNGHKNAPKRKKVGDLEIIYPSQTRKKEKNEEGFTDFEEV